MTTIITVKHKDTERDIALFSGLGTEELSDLLSSVFTLPPECSVIGKL